MRRAKPRARTPYRRTGNSQRRVLRNRRRPNYLLLFCIFTLVAVVAGSVSYVLTTPSLDICSVDIKGVRLADKSAIEKSVSRAKGHNILLVRTSPIIREVGRLNEVRLVKMGRRFPDRMWLRVWERKADAVLVTSRGYYLVQNDGFVFHQVSGPIKNIPLVEVIGNQKLGLGKITSSPSIQCTLEILRISCKQGIKIGKISVDPQGDICLNMDSDFCVKLGQPDDIALKMSLLRNTLAHRPSIVHEGAYIDLSCPSAPVWKRKVATLTAS